MKIEIGNKVKFLNENLKGVIKAVSSNSRVVVEASDGFDYEVRLSEIVIVREDNSHQYNVDANIITKKVSFAPKSTSKGVLSKYRGTTKYQFEQVVEIDLHLEELVEFPSKLEDWQKLHTQIQHAKKCLNAAFDEKINRVVFIHGVGTGVLKTELLNFLANYDGIIVKDADSREYGSGATEVVIK